MAKYHYNPKTGRASKCHALIKKCPLGEANHETFKTQGGATAWARDLRERELSQVYSSDSSLRKNSSKTTVTEAQKKLNITVKANHYNDVLESKYFQEKTIGGVLNYKNLDADSYKEFGFPEVTDNFDNRIKVKDLISSFQIMDKESKRELAKHSANEKKALRFYSSEAHRWINSELYRPGSLNFQKSETNDVVTTESFYDGDFSYTPWVGKNHVTKEFFQGTINKLDKALRKGPKKQRIVYRGALIDDERTDGGFHYIDPSEWIDKNRALGTELTFSGYSSTTSDIRTAKSFSKENNIIYEILTPEGVNITSASEIPSEKEILLPRNQRYIVVGVHKNIASTGKNGKNRFNLIQMVAINSKGEILEGSNSDPITGGK